MFLQLISQVKYSPALLRWPVLQNGRANSLLVYESWANDLACLEVATNMALLKHLSWNQHILGNQMG